MRISVCELRNYSQEILEEDLEMIKKRAEKEETELLLLPECSFYKWIFKDPKFCQEEWENSLRFHQKWMEKLSTLNIPYVVSTTPKNSHNVSYLYSKGEGIKFLHEKVYLPNDENFYEASWYKPSRNSFDSFKLGEFNLSTVICTEIWFMNHARDFANKNIDIVLNPRATEEKTLDKWLAGGRAYSVISGAYSFSSNLRGDQGHDEFLGGGGWGMSPDGEVLGVTSRKTPFLTFEANLEVSKAAKLTYPRYVINPY